MKDLSTKNFLKGKTLGNVVIAIVLIVLLYILISIYFAKHFFFNTVINGVEVSLKAHSHANGIIKNYTKDYKLQLIERNNEIEEIEGKDIGMLYNEQNSISKVYEAQKPMKWISSLFKKQKYYVEDLFSYNAEDLESKIIGLNCLNRNIIEPRNVSFKYSNGSYEVIEEVYGNKIIKDKLVEVIKTSIVKGETKLDLDQNQCYESPKYVAGADKALQTKNLLDKCIRTKVTYLFDKNSEVLDEGLINQWLSTDENLDVVIDKKAVFQYVLELRKKYDTAGTVRKIKTSLGKTVEVKGGFYGWKINISSETKALLENINKGDVVEREPVYTQRAITRGENDIGNTYVEINITRQHLWFYKDGKLVTQGAVVTGNPNRGNATSVGIYMLNYKEEGSTLRGANYEAEVTYWMPFNGNIGIHDASWRYSFGGEIYKNNGTHGCVNAPTYLAKTIFEKIEPGTPIICYEEEKLK